MTRLFLVLGFMTAATVVAQTPPGSCSPQSVLNTATGQPGWMLVSSPGVTASKAAVVVPKPTPGWSPLSGASWVSVDGSGGSKGGAYTYQFTFCLCLSPHQAVASVFSNCDCRTGFTRQASILASCMCRTSLQWPTDVSMINTVSLNNGSALIAAASVAPSISGIW